MDLKTFELTDADGVRIVLDRYLPNPGAGRPRAAVQIAHGWAEHAGRYGHVASALTRSGYAVYADDHRGHGRTGLANTGLGDLGPGGMDGVVQAVHDVTTRIRDDWPDTPFVLLGHSWGSFIAQRFIRHWGAELAAAVLTGTTDRAAGAGRRDRTFEGRTPYDWLTRDRAEVDRYMADVWCGFERMRRDASEPPPTIRPLPEDGAVPVGLPILILNGADDPIGGDEGGRALGERYRAEGVVDVTFTSYPAARHELFNELNRAEVIADVLDWLDRRLPR